MERLSNSIKRNLFYGGLSREDYAKVKDVVKEANRRNIISHSIITLLFWAVAFAVYDFEHYDDLLKIFPYALFICLIFNKINFFFEYFFHLLLPI